MPSRRALLALAASFAALPALAHHGWRWTTDGTFELTGVIEKAELGNPHGLLTVTANGEAWIVEVGQPRRNERACLKDEMMVAGVEITVRGKRSADPAQRVVKAERVLIGGTLYDLYPDRP